MRHQFAILTFLAIHTLSFGQTEEIKSIELIYNHTKGSELFLLHEGDTTTIGVNHFYAVLLDYIIHSTNSVSVLMFDNAENILFQNYTLNDNTWSLANGKALSSSSLLKYTNTERWLSIEYCLKDHETLIKIDGTKETKIALMMEK